MISSSPPNETGAAALVDWPALTRSLRPENSPGFLLWQVTNQWQRSLRAALAPLGLTHVQYVLLAGLAWLEGRETVVSQSRLAQFCKTDAMMTSQVVRTLADAGLLQRGNHPKDNRAKALHLTEVGAATLNLALPLVMRADEEFFGHDAEARRTVTAGLRKLWKDRQDDRD